MTGRILLETERLVLRAFTAGDADLLVELDGDPEVMRFLNGGIPTSRAFIEREIVPRFTAYDGPDGAFGFWAAHRRPGGEFVGWFSLRKTDADVAALGYRLRRAAWGQGLATEGSRALIAKAFDELGIGRVWASTYQDNLASQRVMEKSGMRFVRRRRETEEDVAASDTFEPASTEPWDGDDIDYAIDRAEFMRDR
jgi:RimJ/RimL family protein N-acetyltransferase